MCISVINYGVCYLTVYKLCVLRKNEGNFKQDSHTLLFCKGFQIGSNYFVDMLMCTIDVLLGQNESSGLKLWCGQETDINCPEVNEYMKYMSGFMYF